MTAYKNQIANVLDNVIVPSISAVSIDIVNIERYSTNNEFLVESRNKLTYLRLLDDYLSEYLESEEIIDDHIIQQIILLANKYFRFDSKKYKTEKLVSDTNTAKKQFVDILINDSPYTENMLIAIGDINIKTSINFPSFKIVASMNGKILEMIGNSLDITFTNNIIGNHTIHLYAYDKENMIKYSTSLIISVQ